MTSLLVIDATGASANGYGEASRQKLVAGHLGLPLEEVQSCWIAIDVTEDRDASAPRPGHVTSTSMNRELAQVKIDVQQRWGKALKELHAIVVVDDGEEGSCLVAGGLGIMVNNETDGRSLMLGVARDDNQYWSVTGSIPEPKEDLILESIQHSFLLPPKVGEFVWFLRDVDRVFFKVLAGWHGQVIAVTDAHIIVRVIEPVPGAEGWDNEIVWTKDESNPVTVAFHQYCVAFDGKQICDFQIGEQLQVSYDDLEQAQIDPDLAYVATLLRKEEGDGGICRLYLRIDPNGPEARTKEFSANMPFALGEL